MEVLRDNIDCNILNSNISPEEMAQMNEEDARQFEAALNIIVNDIPISILNIENILNEIAQKIQSLEETSLSFNINFEDLNTSYNNFIEGVLDNAGLYEFEIINIINIYNNINSEHDSSNIDYNFLSKLPFLGTLTFTFFSYFGNGNKLDDFPQLMLDGTGIYLDRDFNSAMGNLAYNGMEFFSEKIFKWNNEIGRNSLAAMALIGVESLIDLQNGEDPTYIAANALGHGLKLFAGNAIVDYVAIPASKYIVEKVALKLGAGKIATVIGGAAGGLVGAGIIVVGTMVLDAIVDPIVDKITGDELIDGTSIPMNGGRDLYDRYYNANSKYYIEENSTKINGMTASLSYCRTLLQNDPEMIFNFDDFKNLEKLYGEPKESAEDFKHYIEELKNISKDSSDLQEQLDKLKCEYSYDPLCEMYIKSLYSYGFDPYEYVMNN